MAELDLPRGPRELLEAVRKPLGDHLGGEHHITLGGGTALAARWAHRHSTDVDLFVKPEPYAELFRNSQRFLADIERHTGAVEQLGVGPAQSLHRTSMTSASSLASSAQAGPMLTLNPS